MEEFLIRNTNNVAGAIGDLQPATLDLLGNVYGIGEVPRALMQGRCFIGGFGLEETITDQTGTALAETTPTFVLRGPDAGQIVAVPLWVKIQLSTEGGAAPSAYISMINTGGEPIVYTSGTAINAINALGGCAKKPLSTLAVTVVLAAYTNSQNVKLDYRLLLDNLITAEGATGETIETVANKLTAYRFPLYPQVPIALYKGSMLAFHAWTNNATKSKWDFTVAWMELDARRINLS